MNKMCISTFVFFDIETTGLPHLECNQTKITELSLIAASAKDIESTSNGSLPLVNKLSLLFNPKRKMSPKVESLTGLSKTCLAQQATFKGKIKTINSFLEELPKPVCLVAHNGNRFDFKILTAEYKDAGAELPVDILCIDSLCGFRKIFKEDNKFCKNSPTKNIKPVSSSSPNTKIMDILTDDEDEWPELNVSAEDWEEIDELTLSLSNISCNEQNIKKVSKSSEKNKDDKVVKDKISFCLTDLYRRLLNKEPIVAHRAEADCMMLLECVTATKTTFIPWANNNSKPLSEIKPLQR